MESLRPPDAGPDLLDLTIRFSASIPDLLLSLPNPHQATTSTLKQQIRKLLPTEFATRRIRLIYAGKALVDNATLSSSLKRQHSQTPSRSSTPLPPDSDNTVGSLKAKGKTPVRDPPSASRIYIHCSIGDVVLSPTDLALEASLANPKADALTPTSSASNLDATPPSTTTPAPRGFDRLLTAGFTQSEILTLRSQFLAIQAHTHTPDTMPSPATLRELEDQWLDNSNTEGASLVSAVEEDGQAGALDDLLWGSVMGFFWPVGCLWWACREEGIWSRRRKMAVVVGFLVNAGFGTLRWMR
jgi:iron-sulfur cluster assembly 1